MRWTAVAVLVAGLVWVGTAWAGEGEAAAAEAAGREAAEGAASKGADPSGDADPSDDASSDDAARSADEDPARDYFTETPLVDQSGTARPFYSGYLKDRVVVISTFAGGCVASCAVAMQKMAAIQKAFGDRVGEDLTLVSITLQPAKDTPDNLAALAAKHEAGKGWHLLSGVVADVFLVLQRLGRAEDHETITQMLLVGNLKTGLWKKLHALGPDDELIAGVRSVVEDTGE